MTQVEFWQEKADRVFANVQVRDSSTIPSVGDLVYVPEAKEFGTYAHVKVVCRRFYYSQCGELTMIRLACETVGMERH
jgi:hypothetical protein